MTVRELHAMPLTREGFEPFGDVIEASEQAVTSGMNDNRFERMDRLALVESVPSDRDVEASTVGIVRALAPSALPYAVTVMERHPLASQAFIPLTRFSFYVVVAPKGAAPGADDLVAFLSNGHQGINYRTGTWHMPLMALESGQTFLVVDQAEREGNLDVITLDETVLLNGPVS